MRLAVLERLRAMRRTNREIEILCFELYQSQFSVPPGDVRYADKPDVVIEGARRVGFEIASLYREHGANTVSEQVQHPRREEALKLAQAAHVAAGRKNFELHVAFAAKHPIADVKSVSAALVSLASRIVDGQPSGFLIRSEFNGTPEIADVYLNPTVYLDSRWRASQVFSVPSLAVSMVRDIVAQKDKLLLQYAPCDEYRLLLVVDFMDSAQDQDLRWPDDEPAVETAFSEVVIFKPQVHERLFVPVLSPGSSDTLARP